MANEHGTPAPEAVELHADLIAHLVHFGLGDGSNFAVECSCDEAIGLRHRAGGEHWFRNWCPACDEDQRHGRDGEGSIVPGTFRLVDGRFKWHLPATIVCDVLRDGCGREFDPVALIERFRIEMKDLDVAPAFAEAVGERLVIERKATRDGETVRYECEGCSRRRHRRARSGLFDVRFGVYRCTRCTWPNLEEDTEAMFASDYNEQTVFGSARHLARHQWLDEPALAEAFLAALARRRTERAVKGAVTEP